MICTNLEHEKARYMVATPHIWLFDYYIFLIVISPQQKSYPKHHLIYVMYSDGSRTLSNSSLLFSL